MLLTVITQGATILHSAHCYACIALPILQCSEQVSLTDLDFIMLEIFLIRYVVITLKGVILF